MAQGICCQLSFWRRNIVFLVIVFQFQAFLPDILGTFLLHRDLCKSWAVSAQNYQLTSSCGGSVQAGGSCTLMCYTGEASHTTIVWQGGTTFYRVSQGSCSSTSPSLPADYTTSCPSSTNYTLTINNAVYGKDRLSWRCDDQFGGRYSKNLSISVLVPLSSVSITRTSTSIYCVAVSNPPPSMTLYRDGISVSTSPAAAEGDTGWTATINSQLTGNSSNSLYYCQASNTQTRVNSSYSYPEIAVSSVSLTNITSANQEVGAAEGQPLTLTCVTLASYPAATVTWYKNSVEVTVGISSSSTVTSGVAVQTTSTVTFNSVGRSDLGHTVYCRATNIHTLSPVQSDSARMGVWFGPEQVGVSKPDNTVAEENRDLTLTCTVTAYPSPTFTWDYSDGTPVGGRTGSVTGSSTRWSQTLTFRPNKDTTTVRCQVSSTRTSTTQTGSISLDVKYPPLDPPSITRFRTVMFDGDPETVSCSVTGGNPLATITWSCPGTGSASVSDSGQMRTSTLSYTVNRTQNSQQCQCQGSWQYGGYSRSDVRTFNVSYAPSKPSITVPPVLCEGRPASSLGCSSSDPGNPAATYTWTKNSLPVSPDFSLPVSPDFSPSRTDNRGTMTCSAVNIFTNRTGHTAPVSDARQLNVHYSPQLSTQPTPSLTRKEGESLSLTCVSDSNPSTSDSDIKWVFGSVETQGPGIQKSNLSRYDDGVYTCRAAVNSGTCGTLQGHREVMVTVNYAPDVNMREADLTEGQTLSLLCHAEGRPSVYTFTRFTQYWGDTEIESLDGEQDSDNYTLTIDSATYLDAGMYECGVDNTVTDRNDVLVQRKRVSVNVRASPKFTDDSKQIFADEVGTDTTLVQSFYNSDLNYTSYNWTFGQLDTPVNRSGSVRSSQVTLRKNNKEVQHAGFSVSLEIQNFQEQDIGVYTVTVCNVVGCNSSQVNLTAAGPPLVPLEFMAVNTTQNSVLLRWKSNFPGGSAYTQVFVLQYRKEGKSGDWETREYVDNPGGYVYADVTGLKSGTGYEFKVMARNNRPANNEGPFTQVESQKTETMHPTTPSSVTAIAAGSGVGGAVLILAVIGLSVLLIKRRRQSGAEKEKPTKPKTSGYHKQGRKDENDLVSIENDIYQSGGPSITSKKEETVMQENDVYQSSGDVQGASNAVVSDVYSQVVKPKASLKKENADGAVSAKPLKDKKTKEDKGKNLNKKKDAAKNKKTKNQKDDEIKLKPKRQQNRGDVYENTVPGQFGDGTYANAGFVGDDDKAGPTEDSSGEGQQSGRDEDGLLYVSVDFGNARPSTEVHRAEEPTEYAGIAFGQVGPPPPPDEEEKK